jgi:hypothetical protein
VAATTFLEQLLMATPSSTQLSSPLTTGPLVFETLARATLPSPRVSSPLPSFATLRTQGLGQEDQYLPAITEQISTVIASDTGSRGHSISYFRHWESTAPPLPPQRGSTSPEWSDLCDDSNEDDASGFSVEPSKAISTSPPDPTSPP